MIYTSLYVENAFGQKRMIGAAYGAKCPTKTRVCPPTIMRANSGKGKGNTSVFTTSLPIFQYSRHCFLFYEYR
jgi:hypothetical protein